MLFMNETSILIASQNIYKFQNDRHTAFGFLVSIKLILLEPQQNIFYSVFW